MKDRYLDYIENLLREEEIFLKTLLGASSAVAAIWGTCWLFLSYLRAAPTQILSAKPGCAPPGVSFTGSIETLSYVSIFAVGGSLLGSILGEDERGWFQTTLAVICGTTAYVIAILHLSTSPLLDFEGSGAPLLMRILGGGIHLALISGVFWVWHRPLVPSISGAKTIDRYIENQYRFTQIILYIVTAGGLSILIPLVFRRGDGPTLQVIIFLIGNLTLPMFAIVAFAALRLHYIEKSRR